MITSRHINRIRRRDESLGFVNESERESKKSERKPIISPLSKEEDPRVKKLKKELEKLDLTPKQQKPKYINFKI